MAEYKITTKNGRPLSRDKYTLDLENRVFGTREHNLFLEFTDDNSWIFRTGSDCAFNTNGFNCTFRTGARCRFNTNSGCVFRTGKDCTFTTGGWCTFHLSDINTCKFKSFDNESTIFDQNDNKHYILSKELIKMLKVANG